MSNVWGWFGGGAAQKKKDTPKNAILGLRAQLDMLQKRESHLQSQIDQQDALARKNVTSNKNAAKAALRRKKAHEHSLEQTQAQIGTLEQQVNAIESANINRETLAAMERAATAMKQIHGGLTPEKVDETMERIQEQNQLSEEIVNAITSNQIGEAVDDADLEEELEQLQQEQLDEKMLDTSVPVSDAVHRLPAAANGESMLSPTPLQSHMSCPHTNKAVKSTPVAEEDDEEAELRKLQAEMAM
ncbi:charged multivesicular body protein 4 [Sporothrix schenckii 1099-18]|uniref:Vacuolar-sorting protein SNF7 n=1 Tax=Sporothrix schenckii 1099-18 TaxID=1397361 RepID=A0A0F2MJ83_SPOSC|nr:charged multivesicular body protein 4 [Sporothrix schenckii 1099-18]KJR89114.1 charged multivesicular body protein 4 [Sporothrix schenckii 1099-18]